MISVSSEDAFNSFCSEKNFSYIRVKLDTDKNQGKYEFVKIVNTSFEQNWSFNYSETSGVYNLSPDVQYVGLFWLESKPEVLYVVDQNIRERDSNQKQVIHRLSDDMNSFDSTNKMVTEFFGCPQPKLTTPDVTPKDGFPL